MAADSKVTSGNVTYPALKIAAVRGHLVGAAGTNYWIHQLLKWYEKDCRGFAPKVGKDDEGDALFLTVDGILVCDSDMVIERVQRDFHAVGSGAQAALSKLMDGATPAEAVQRACEIDNESGGPVQVYHLAEVPVPKRRTRKV